MSKSPVQTTAHFFGYCWLDVGPEHWETKRTAFSFFTPAAMNYYLPSLIQCSLEDPHRMEMAVDNVIFELNWRNDDAQATWLDSRWMTLSVAQIEIVIVWLNKLIGVYESDSDDQISMALQTLYGFQERKREEGGAKPDLRLPLTAPDLLRDDTRPT